MTQGDEERFRPNVDQIDAIVRKASARRRARAWGAASAAAAVAVYAGGASLVDDRPADAIGSVSTNERTSPTPSAKPSRATKPTPRRTPAATAKPTARPSTKPSPARSTRPVVTVTRTSSATAAPKPPPPGATLSVAKEAGGYAGCEDAQDGVVTRVSGDFCLSLTPPPNQMGMFTFAFRTCLRPGATPASLDYSGGDEIHVAVMSQGGTVWRWPGDDGRAHSRTLGPGDCWVWSMRWQGVTSSGQQVPDGEYVVEARTVAAGLSDEAPLYAGFTVRRQPR